MDDFQLKELNLLVARLERLSADSYWAHRSSGLRGSLLRFQERIEQGQAGSVEDQARLDGLLRLGFDLLYKAAREIPEPRRQG